MARRYHGKKPFEQRPVQKEGNRFGPRQRGPARVPTCERSAQEQLLQRARQMPPQTTEYKPTPEQILRQIRRER